MSTTPRPGTKTLYHTMRWECRNIIVDGPRTIPCNAGGFGSGLEPDDVARLETEAGDHFRETGHAVEIVNEHRRRYDARGGG